jgi:hypothetical protein
MAMGSGSAGFIGEVWARAVPGAVPKWRRAWGPPRANTFLGGTPFRTPGCLALSGSRQFSEFVRESFGHLVMKGESPVDVFLFEQKSTPDVRGSS